MMINLFVSLLTVILVWFITSTTSRAFNDAFRGLSILWYQVVSLCTVYIYRVIDVSDPFTQALAALDSIYRVSQYECYSLRQSTSRGLINFRLLLTRVTLPLLSIWVALFLSVWGLCFFMSALNGGWIRCRLLFILVRESWFWWTTTTNTGITLTSIATSIRGRSESVLLRS